MLRPACIALLALLLVPATAAAAPPPNDAHTAPGVFEAYSARNGFPIERQAVAELAEATPDAGVARCLGPTSMARTAWYVVPGTPNARELTVEAIGRTIDAIDLAAFVQASPAAPRRPNVCGGAGVFGDDATEDRTTAIRLRVPAFHQVLVQVGRRGPAGPAEDERAFLSLEDIPLPPIGSPVGDRAGRTTPLVPRTGRTLVDLGGATTTGEDPAVPSCPAVAGVWRRARVTKPGPWTLSVAGDAVGEISVFAGSTPRAETLLGCIDREGPGPLVLPVRVRTRKAVWVRIGADRPGPDAEAALSWRRRVRGDARSGGGCLASSNSQVRGGPARRTRAVAEHGRRRAFELRLRVLRGPVCAARIELRGPGGVTYARGDVPSIRGRGQLVLLPRVRRLRKGLYRLRIEAAGLAGVRRRVPSTVLFRLK